MSISSLVPPRRPHGYRGVMHLPLLVGVFPLAHVLCAQLVTGPLRASLFVHIWTGLLMAAASVALNYTDDDGWYGAKPLMVIDHTMIVVFVAGTFTPMATALGGRPAWVVLAAMWLLAPVRMVMAWIGYEPRWLTSVIAAASALLPLPVIFLGLPLGLSLLVVVGNLLYLVGGLVYHYTWPNPKPHWFGAHGVFHTFTIGGAVLHLIVTFSLALG